MGGWLSIRYDTRNDTVAPFLTGRRAAATPLFIISRKGLSRRIEHKWG